MDTHSFQNKNFHQIEGDFKSTLGDRVALQNVESLKSHCEYYCTFNKDFSHKLKKQQNYVSKAKDVFAELWGRGPIILLPFVNLSFTVSIIPAIVLLLLTLNFILF